MKHIKLFEQFVNEDKIQNALDNIDKWMPEDSELQDEYYQLINTKDEKGMEEFLDMYADEDRLMKYGIKFQDLGKLAKAILKESLNEDLSKSEVTQIEKYLSKLDASVLFDMVNDFYTEDDEWNEIKNDLDKSELEVWALAHIKSDAIKLNDLKSMYESTVNEATETAINQLAKDEQSEGYDAKVFLGKFDGQTFKAQSTDRTWDDGVPVMKNFSRNGFKPVSLKGEYQLVDSDRGWWYIQGPKNMWYAVKHADYGTPPFEY